MADAAADTDPVDTQEKEDATVDLYELERVRSFCSLWLHVCMCARNARTFVSVVPRGKSVRIVVCRVGADFGDAISSTERVT